MSITTVSISFVFISITNKSQCFYITSREYDESLQWSAQEEGFNAVVNNDLEQLKKEIAKGYDIDATKSEGMTMLHFAVDRGYIDIASYLIECGANINARDHCEQTPIMLAVICEHKDIVELLVRKGADLSLKNNEGLCAADLEDIPDDIAALLRS